ncbi:MAG: hypothetical protein NC211_01685 [Alistipes senegalensis]|nr:hypothetical protein [Oxalobacter formigenes]MCM1280536.1 hypothetical protein [Alistipes senegalensis]
MKTTTAENTAKPFPFRLGVIGLLLAALLLTGCARPNEENVKQLLSTAYQCKWLTLDGYEKIESLPGIWSYVIRYNFDLNLAEGENSAKQFMQGLYRTAPGETDWQKVFENPKARAYLRDGCSLPAQKIMEQVAIHTYLQMHDKKTADIEIPVTIHMTGWAEMSTGRSGWKMDMRRDKVDPKYVLSAPMPRKTLTAAAH